MDDKYVLNQVNQAVGNKDARKVVLKAKRDGPLMTVTYFIDRDENFHQPETTE